MTLHIMTMKREARLADAARFTAAFVVLFAAYMLYSEVPSPAELIAGAGCALVGATAMRSVHRNTRRRFAVRPGWVLWLIVKQVPLAIGECGGLFRALFRTADERAAGIGQMITIPFDGTSGRTEAEAAGRRALITTAICFTPNSVVIGLEMAPGHLLLHQLVPTAAPGSGDPIWPI